MDKPEFGKLLITVAIFSAYVGYKAGAKVGIKYLYQGMKLSPRLVRDGWNKVISEMPE